MERHFHEPAKRVDESHFVRCVARDIAGVLAASRHGDFEALISLLHPDVVLRTDRSILPPGAPAELRGASVIAERAVKGGARAAQPALVNDEVGVIVAPRGRLLMVLCFTIANDRVVAIEAVGDKDRLAELRLAALGLEVDPTSAALDSQ